MSDFRARLEQELIQAAGRPRRVRYAGTMIPLPRTIATAAVVLAVLVGASALLTRGLPIGSHGDQVAATAPPSQAHLANQALSALLARGTPLTEDQKAAVASRAITEYVGDLGGARSITPPPGDGTQWVLVPASDGSGSACLSIITVGAACGGADLVAATGIAITKLERPGNPTEPWAPGGRVYVYGIVPTNVTSIAVLNTDHRVVKQVNVVAQTYRYDVPTEDLGSIEFRNSEGRTTAVTPGPRRSR
jgi:hypothetical protein